MDKINLFGPDILIIPFGADPQGHFDLDIDDPRRELQFPIPVSSQRVDSKRSVLKEDDYADIGTFIRKRFCNNPIVITQEGGYCIEEVGTIVYNFIRGIVYNKVFD